MALSERVGRKSNRGGAATKADLAIAIIYDRERAHLRVVPRPAIPLRSLERIEYDFDSAAAWTPTVKCVRSTGGLL